MLDRLIYLLEGTLKDWECDVQPETVSQIAEHLIENGVLVTPCAIETTVYATHVSNLMDVVKGEVIRYAFNIHGDLCVDVEYENGKAKVSRRECGEYDITLDAAAVSALVSAPAII